MYHHHKNADHKRSWSKILNIWIVVASKSFSYFFEALCVE
ncbi:unnamed protein product [Arabidopsis lyrata]|nr:unnamed protein product [Arabidopsis lyrata]